MIIEINIFHNSLAVNIIVRDIRTFIANYLLKE